MLQLPEELIILVICAVASTNAELARRAAQEKGNIPGDAALVPLSMTSRLMRRLTLPMLFSKICLYRDLHITDPTLKSRFQSIKELVLASVYEFRQTPHDLQTILNACTSLEHVQIEHSLYTHQDLKTSALGFQEVLASHSCTVLVTRTRSAKDVVKTQPTVDLSRTTWEFMDLDHAEVPYLDEYLERGLRIQVLRVTPRGTDAWKRQIFPGISMLEVDCSVDSKSEVYSAIDHQDITNFRSRHPTLHEVLMHSPLKSANLITRFQDMPAGVSVSELRLTKEHAWEALEASVEFGVNNAQAIMAGAQELGPRVPFLQKLSVKAEFTGKLENFSGTCFSTFPNVTHLVLDLKTPTLSDTISHAVSYSGHAYRRFNRLLNLYLLRWMYGIAREMRSLCRITFTSTDLLAIIIREPLTVQQAKKMDGDHWIASGPAYSSESE